MLRARLVLSCLLALLSPACGDGAIAPDAASPDGDLGDADVNLIDIADTAEADTGSPPPHVNPAGSGATVTVTIGPEGGTATLGALRLVFPPNALAAPTAIVLTEEATAAPDAVRARTPIYRAEPDGLVLRVPAAATLTVAAAASPVGVMWSMPGSGAERPRQRVVADWDAAAGEVRFQIGHFSTGVAVEDPWLADYLADYRAAGETEAAGEALAAALVAYVTQLPACGPDVVPALVDVATIVQVLVPGLAAADRAAILAQAAARTGPALACERQAAGCDLAGLDALAGRAGDLPLLAARGLLSGGAFDAERERFETTYVGQAQCATTALARCDTADLGDDGLELIHARVSDGAFVFPDARETVLGLIRSQMRANVSCAGADAPTCLEDGAYARIGLERLEVLGRRLPELVDHGLLDGADRTTLETELGATYRSELGCVLIALDTCANETEEIYLDPLTELFVAVDVDPFPLGDAVADDARDGISATLADNLGCIVERQLDEPPTPDVLAGLEQLDGLLDELVDVGILRPGDASELHTYFADSWEYLLGRLLDTLDECVTPSDDFHTSALFPLHDSVTAPDFAFEQHVAAARAAISERLADNYRCGLEGLEPSEAALEAVEQLDELAEAVVDAELLLPDDGDAVHQDAGDAWLGLLTALLETLAACGEDEADPLAAEPLASLHDRAKDPEFRFGAAISEPALDAISARLSDNIACVIERLYDEEPSREVLASIARIEVSIQDLRTIDLLRPADAAALHDDTGDLWTAQLEALLETWDSCESDTLETYAQELLETHAAVIAADFPWEDDVANPALDLISARMRDNLTCLLDEARADEPSAELLGAIEALGDTIDELTDAAVLRGNDGSELLEEAGEVWAAQLADLLETLDGCPADPVELYGTELVALHEMTRAPDFAFSGPVAEDAVVAISDRAARNLHCLIDEAEAEIEASIDLLATLEHAADIVAEDRAEGLFTESDAAELDAHLDEAWQDAFVALLAHWDLCDPQPFIPVAAFHRELHALLSDPEAELPREPAAARAAQSAALVEGLACMKAREEYRSSVHLLWEIEQVYREILAFEDEEILTGADAASARDLFRTYWDDELDELLAGLDVCEPPGVGHLPTYRELVAQVDDPEATLPEDRPEVRRRISQRVAEGLTCLADRAATLEATAGLLRDIEDAFREDVLVVIAEGLVLEADAPPMREAWTDAWDDRFAALVDTLRLCEGPPYEEQITIYLDLLDYLTDPEVTLPEARGPAREAIAEQLRGGFECVADQYHDRTATLDALEELVLIAEDVDTLLHSSGLSEPRAVEANQHIAEVWQTTLERYDETLDACQAAGARTVREEELRALSAHLEDAAVRIPQVVPDARELVSERAAGNLGCVLEEVDQDLPSADKLGALGELWAISARLADDGVLAAEDRQTSDDAVKAAWLEDLDALLAELEGCALPAEVQADDLRELLELVADGTPAAAVVGTETREAVSGRLADNLDCLVAALTEAPARPDLDALEELIDLAAGFRDEGLLLPAARDAFEQRVVDAWRGLYDALVAGLDCAVTEAAHEAELMDLVDAARETELPIPDGVEVGAQLQLYDNLVCAMGQALLCVAEDVALVDEIDAITSTYGRVEELGAIDYLDPGDVLGARDVFAAQYAASFACLEQHFDSCTRAPHGLFRAELFGLADRLEAADMPFPEQVEDGMERLRARLTANFPCAAAFAATCDLLGPDPDSLLDLEALRDAVEPAVARGLLADDDREAVVADLETAYDPEFRCVVAGFDSCADLDDGLYEVELGGLHARLDAPAFAYADLAPELEATLHDRAAANVSCEAQALDPCEIPSMDLLEDLASRTLDLELDHLLDPPDGDDLREALGDDYERVDACVLLDADGCNGGGALHADTLDALEDRASASGFQFPDRAAALLAAIRAQGGRNVLCAIDALPRCGAGTPAALSALERDTLPALLTQRVIDDETAQAGRDRIAARKCEELVCDAALTVNGAPLGGGSVTFETADACPLDVTVELTTTPDPDLPLVSGAIFRVDANPPVAGGQSFEAALERGRHRILGGPVAAGCPDVMVGGGVTICCGQPEGEECEPDREPIKYGSPFGRGPVIGDSGYGVYGLGGGGPSGNLPTTSILNADAWGDPHLTTADGSQFTSLDLGEFVYMTAPPGEVGAVEVQVRHARLPGFANWASFNTAVALRAGETVFEVRMPRLPNGAYDLSARRPLELLLDGALVDLAPGGYAVDPDVAFKVGAGGALTVFARDPLATHAGGVVSIQVGLRGELGLLRVDADPSEPVLSLDVSIQAEGGWRGLLGTPNHDGADDFLLPSGANVRAPTLAFVESWRVTTREASLFTYEPGEGPETWDVPQPYALPAEDELGPWIASVEDIVSRRCGADAEAIAALDPVLVTALAYERAAGRSEASLVAGGLCGDPRIAPGPEALVGFAFSGRVTLADRPELGAGGVTVTVVAVEPGLVLCEGRSAPDGAWACALRGLPEAYVALETLTLRLTARGRGDDVVVERVVDAPDAGDPTVVVAQDLAVAPQRALVVTGTVTSAAGLPAADALVSAAGLGGGSVLSDGDGAYQLVLALPDGLSSGVLTISALGLGGFGHGAVSIPLASLPLGVTEVTGDVALDPAPARPPITQAVAYVVVQGRVTNRTVRETLGVEAPLVGAAMGLDGAGWTLDHCSGPTTADGHWYCTALCAVEACAPELAVTVDGVAEGVATLAGPPEPGARIFLPSALEVARTTLEVTGRLTTPDGTPLGGATVTARTSAGDEGAAETDGDGRYRVFVAATGASALEAAAGTVAVTFRWAAAPGAPAHVETASADFDVPAGRVAGVVVDATLSGKTVAFTGRVVNGLLAANDPLRGVAGARVVIAAAERGVLCDVRSAAASAPADVGYYRCEVPLAAGDGPAWSLTWTVSGTGAAVAEGPLDLAAIPLGTVFPVARTLTVTPATLLVSGVVRDQSGHTVPGAKVGPAFTTVVAGVGAGAGGISATTGSNGAYVAVVAVPDALAGGAGAVAADARWGTGALTRRGRGTAAAVATAGALTPVVADVTLDGDVPPDELVGDLRFSGWIRNTHVPGAGLPRARVEIAGSGDSSELGVLCTAQTDRHGRYSCGALIAESTATSLTLSWRVSLGATELAEVVATRTIVRSAAVANALDQDVAVAPTTVTLTGRVRAGDNDGQPFPGVAVSLLGSSSWLSGSATTDEQGTYTLHAMLPDEAPAPSGALSVSALGAIVSAPFSAAPAPREHVTLAQHLAFPFYHVNVAGTLDNLNAPGSLVPGVDLALTADGQVFCRATSTRDGFACAAPLLREPADGPLALEWVATRPDGAQSQGTVTVGEAELPGPGGSLALAVAATIGAPALTVTGRVASAADTPLADLPVRVALPDATKTATTGADGRYAVTLSYAAPELLPAVSATATRDLHAVTATAEDVALADALVELPLDVAFPVATQLRVRGMTRNANDAAAPLAGGALRVEVSGAELPRQALCEADAADGAFDCGGVLAGVALDALDVHFTWLRGGLAWTDPVTVALADLAADGAPNLHEADVAFAPTTVRLSGAVTNGTGGGIHGASVRFDGPGADHDGVTLTGPTGAWTLTLVLPPGAVSVDGTLSATRLGNQAQVTLAEPVAPGGRTELSRDLVLATRRLVLKGRVVSAYGDAGVPAMAVSFSRDGQVVCERTSAGGGTGGFATIGVFTCPTLELADAGDVVFDWAVSGPYPAASGTLTVPAAALPPAGTQGNYSFALPIPVKTLLLSGTLRRGGAPVSGSVTGVAGGLSRTVSVSSGGGFTLPFVFPEADTTATVDLVGSDASNSGTAQAVVPLVPDGLTTATQDLAISDTGPGTAAWSATVSSITYSPLDSHLAPAYDPATGRLYAAVDTSLRAVDAATGELFWSAFVPGEVRSNVLLAGGHVWIMGADGRLLGFTDLGTSAVTHADLTSVTASAAHLVAGYDGVLLVVGQLQQAGVDMATGTRLWHEQTPIIGGSPPALHADGTLIIPGHERVIGRLVGADGTLSRFDVASPGSARAPALRSDGAIVVVGTAGARLLTPGGEVLAALDWPEAGDVSHPALLPDERVVVVVDGHLRVLRVAGESFEVDLDVPLGAAGQAEEVAPVLVADGAGTAAYVTTEDTVGCYLHGVRLTGPLAGTAVFPPYLAPGATELTAATAPPGLVVAMSRTKLYAVVRPSGDLAAGPWPMLGRGFDNALAAPPDGVPRRVVALSGQLTNANAPAAALDGVAVRVTLNGDTLATGVSADGAWAASAPLTVLDAVDVDVSASYLGATASVTVGVPAGGAGSAHAEDVDLALPITTHVLTGVLMNEGAPAEGLEVTAVGADVVVLGAPATSGPDGAYELVLGFPAGASEGRPIVRVTDPDGVPRAFPLVLALTPGGLTTSLADLEVGPPEPLPGHDLAALFPTADSVYLTAPDAAGAGVVSLLHAYSGCGTGNCTTDPWLVAVDADGEATLSNAGLTANGYGGAPTVGPTGHVYTPFVTTEERAGVWVHDASLALVDTLELPLLEPGISPVAVAGAGLTPRVYALVDPDWDYVDSELVAWDVDLAASTHTTAFATPLAAPICEGRCVLASASVVAVATGPRVVLLDAADGSVIADVPAGGGMYDAAQAVLAGSTLFVAPGTDAVLGLDLAGAPLAGFPVTLPDVVTAFGGDATATRLWALAGGTLVELDGAGAVVGSEPEVCDDSYALAAVEGEVWVSCAESLLRYGAGPTLLQQLPVTSWLDYPAVLTATHVFAVAADGVVTVAPRP